MLSFLVFLLTVGTIVKYKESDTADIPDILHYVDNEYILLYAFFWVNHRRLNLDAGELPRIKHTTLRTRRKFEINNEYIAYCCLFEWNLTLLTVAYLNGILHCIWHSSVC
jgi:hypothetical protein